MVYSQRTVPGLVLGLLFETAAQPVEGTIASAIDTVRIDMEFFMILRCLLGGWGSMRALGVLAVHRPWAFGWTGAAGGNGIKPSIVRTDVEGAIFTDYRR